MEANEILIRLFQLSWLLVLSLTPRFNLVRAFSQVGRAPVIRVASGDIEGRRMVLTPPHLVPVYQYLGVPYATPPVGPRRFRPPHTPGPSWEGTRNATKFGPSCPQKIQEPTEDTPFWKSNVMNQKKPFLQNMSEDCLYLNIYVPERDETQSMDPLAVMVHIHGDTYDEGSANMYDGSILASYGGVIVITVNYRLGILGFLSTADSAARGNYGLMDQIAALKWIHQNIAVFGGNPNRITLFGVGSGAACSGLLMFSNHTKGLIAGVIAESGSANAPWALSREPARFANLLAEHVGCEAETNLQMVECLRGLPYSDLINLDFQSPLYMFAFAPVVDEDVIAADPSIMWGQLIAGERDIGRDDFAYLSGIVRNEAFSYIAEETDVVGRMELEVFDDILDGFVQNNFGGNMKASVIRDVIYYEYMDWGGGEGNAFTLKDSLQDILTDHQWVAPCISSLKMADEAGIDAWLYMFPHRPRRSIYPRWAGAVHLEEVPYVFGAPVSNLSVGIFTESYSSAEAALSLATMNYWSNFAKSGNPNSPRPQSSTDIHRNFVVEFNFETMEDWPRYTVGRQQMIYLASNPKAKDFYRVHKISLWEQLVPRIEQKFAFEPTVNNNPFLPGPQISNPGGGQVTHSITSAMMPVTSAISPMTDPFETDIDNRVPGADITPSGTESNALETEKQEKKGFLVELSMVIAIGGFLLLLNLIILGAIYYLRDKRKIEKRLAQKYLTSQTEEKKRTSLHPQTTPDSGIGIPVALNLNQQSGHHGSNQRYVTPSAPSRAGTSDHNHGNGGNRDYSSLKYNRSPQHFGAIRRNSAGEVEFEV